jgi:hypothetical protein
MKDLFEEIEGFEPKEKTVDDICLWHESPSITKGNEMYQECHLNCDGYKEECPYYRSVRELMDS